MAMTIDDYKKAYAEAYKVGDYNAMRAANEGANAIRTANGEATYDSSKGDAQRANTVAAASKPATPSNRYNTTVYDTAGKGSQGYIENGATYLQDGSRLPDGWSVYDSKGRYYTMNEGKGVQTTPQGETAKLSFGNAGTYQGNRYVTYNGLNIDMNKDYEAMYNQYAGDPQAQKVIEKFRNAKVAYLNSIGIDPDNIKETDRQKDTQLIDDSTLRQGYEDFEKSQYALRDAQINTANAEANTALAGLENQRGRIADENRDALRSLWVDTQLSQKRLEEALAAQGITGGNAESALLDTLTAYQSGYGNQIRGYNNTIADIDASAADIRNNLATNVAAIRATYGDRVADAYLEYKTRRGELEGSAESSIINRLGL